MIYIRFYSHFFFLNIAYPDFGKASFQVKYMAQIWEGRLYWVGAGKT